MKQYPLRTRVESPILDAAYELAGIGRIKIVRASDDAGAGDSVVLLLKGAGGMDDWLRAGAADRVPDTG
ncbi:MAG: hypothetical protein H0U97_22955 [Gammaproteobacteria bacterium]|nr:hypothetical protein [Gammaproteobacteria bacterium]